MLYISEDLSKRRMNNDTECNWFEWDTKIIFYITVKLDTFLCCEISLLLEFFWGAVAEDSD